MKKYTLSVTLVMVSLLSLWSCQSSKSAAESSTSSATPQKTQKKDNINNELEKSLLWEISGNNLTESSYLYGTIHIIDGEQYFLPPGTLSAIDQSSQLVFEIDMGDMTDMSKLMPLMQKTYMRDGLTLKDVMSAEGYATVQAHFKKIGLPLMLFERMKPMFISVLGSIDMNPMDLQNGKIKSYEMEFNKIAEQSGKPTGGLETIEYQLAIFDSIPYEDQAEMLLQSIQMEEGESASQLDALVELYISQDVQGLYDAMKGDESIEAHEDILLNQRNKNWIPVMSDMMSDQRSFFAVGAGHLGGPEGVINLLRQAGYTVTAYRG